MFPCNSHDADTTRRYFWLRMRFMTWQVHSPQSKWSTLCLQTETSFSNLEISYLYLLYFSFIYDFFLCVLNAYSICNERGFSSGRLRSIDLQMANVPVHSSASPRFSDTGLLFSILPENDNLKSIYECDWENLALQWLKELPTKPNNNRLTLMQSTGWKITQSGAWMLWPVNVTGRKKSQVFVVCVDSSAHFDKQVDRRR